MTSYSLEVKVKPDVALITEGDWSDVPKESTNHASDAQNYMPEGWTFAGTHFYLDGGFISPGRDATITIAPDMAGYNKVSVIINAKAYSKGSNTTIDVSSDVEEAHRIVLAKELDTYLVVLEVGDGGYVKITSGYYPEIQSIAIYGGEITDVTPFSLRAAVETGNGTYRLIEGITPDKFYVVNGLMPGLTYLYRVKSIYVNGTESTWSRSKEVTLGGSPVITIGDVNGDGEINISDVVVLIDYLLNGTDDGINLDAADIDTDGAITISDVTNLIDLLLTGGK